MSYRVRILRRAWTDADAIFNWLHARSVSGATRCYAAFLAAANDLSNNPYRFSVVPEFDVSDVEVRHRLFKTRHGRLYRLIFLIHTEEVRILRVRGPGQAPVHFNELDL